MEREQYVEYQIFATSPGETIFLWRCTATFTSFSAAQRETIAYEYRALRGLRKPRWWRTNARNREAISS